MRAAKRKREIRAETFDEAADMLNESASKLSAYLKETRPDMYPWWPEEVQRLAHEASKLRRRALQIRRNRTGPGETIPVAYDEKIGWHKA